jgi:O-antigen biosynthesis protein
MNNKKVSVVIPNYNGKNLLKKFLPSVISALRDGDELVIVDDLSPDDSVSWLIKEYKLKLTKRSFNKNEISRDHNPDIYNLKFKLYSNWITVKTTDKSKTKKTKKIRILLVSQLVNLRFGASANVGVVMASNEYIFLLNSDVKATDGVVDQLLTHFSDRDVFAVGCLEYERTKTGDKSGKNLLWFEQGFFKHSKAEDFTTGDTAWASGGSGMFSKSKWLQLGGFDKLYYPAYWEDIDLSFRALKKGWKVLFDEKAVVYHVHETTNIDAFGQKRIDDMSWNNAQKFAVKNASFFQKIQYYLYKPYWSYKRKAVTKKIPS